LTAVYEAGVAASRAFGAEIDGSKL